MHAPEFSSTSTTEQLVACFELILQAEKLTPDDDFFELGGDSMAAAQLLVEIEKWWGVKLPSALLIEHPTISALARAIERSAEANLKGKILAIKESGSSPPVFMTHSNTGDLWVACNLVPHLSNDQPLYAIKPDFSENSFSSFRELTAQNVKILLKEYPQQEYRLLGYSFGALLAFEMARQLEARGHRVSFLGIMDIRPDIRKRWVRLKDRSHRNGFFSTVAWSAGWIHGWYVYEHSRQSLTRIITRLFQTAWFRVKYVFSSKVPADTTEHDDQNVRSRFERQAVNAILDHVPGHYSGDIALFVTKKEGVFLEYELISGWREFTSGKVEVIPVEGSHRTIVRNPLIRQIANRLNVESGEKQA